VESFAFLHLYPLILAPSDGTRQLFSETFELQSRSLQQSTWSTEPFTRN
jgi:hypothetical protein